MVMQIKLFVLVVEDKILKQFSIWNGNSPAYTGKRLTSLRASSLGVLGEQEKEKGKESLH